MSIPNRFGRELLAFANRSGAPRKWRRQMRESVPVGIQLCEAILADLAKQDWQQLEKDFELLYGILKHACADCSTDRFRKPALDGWVYDALIVPVLRSAAPRTRVKAALTFEWRCGCCLLGEAEVAEVLRFILPLAVLPAPAAGIEDRVNIIGIAMGLVEREISVHREGGGRTSSFATAQIDRLRWFFGVRCGLLETLLACFDLIATEEKESQDMDTAAGSFYVEVGEILVEYVEEMLFARKDFASDLAMTLLKAFQQYPLWLQETELNLEAAAFPDQVKEELMVTWCCGECAVDRSGELAGMLAVLAEAHPSLAAYLRSRGLQQKAESWHVRLPGAQQPLGKLLTAFARLPAADSREKQQQEGGSKGLKACALCGTVPNVNSGAQHGDSTAQVAKLRCCSACRSVHYCCRACQLVHWPLHRQACKRM